MKENNGYAARRKLLRKLGIVLAIFLFAMGALLFFESNLTDVHSGGKRQSLFNKLRHSRRRGKDGVGEEYARILAAELHLIDIEMDAREMRYASKNSYEGIYGSFCKLNFKAHKEDPSSIPMFRDLQAASPDCESTRVRVPLKEIATLAREQDETNNREPTGEEVPKPLNFTGIVFHESRCGSTLVANTLIGMDPARHRVYSESPPPVTGLRICGDDYERCSIEQAAEIFKDVIYMMGRTNDPVEERVFFKIQSVGSRHIEVFRKAFPTTPWLFVYRDPVQVMMSHMANGVRHANCLRSLSRPPQITKDLVKRHGFKGGTSQLAPEEFCAAHLATITETALENLKQSHHGYAVNYANLPGIMYDHILPEKFGVLTGEREIERILQVSSQYSKGRGGRKKEWKDDSEKKEEEASAAIREAAKHFMMESYYELEEISIVG